MSLNIKYVAFPLFPIEHMSNTISKLSHSVFFYPVSQLLWNLGCTNKKTLICCFTEKYIVMLVTKTASTQCLFNPVYPRYTIPLTVSHMYCGADRQIEIYSDHDYISPVCLPGHVLVKLWLSTTSSQETRMHAHTQAMSTPSSPTQPDPSIRTLLSSVVWYTPQCQLFSLSLGMWSTKLLDSPLSFHWGRFLWKDVWED